MSAKFGVADRCREAGVRGCRGVAYDGGKNGKVEERKEDWGRDGRRRGWKR